MEMTTFFYSSAILFLSLMSPEGLTVYFFLFAEVERMPRKFGFLCQWHYYCNYGSIQMGLISFFTFTSAPYPLPLLCPMELNYKGQGLKSTPQEWDVSSAVPDGFHMSRCDMFFCFFVFGRFKKYARIQDVVHKSIIKT